MDRLLDEERAGPAYLRMPAVAQVTAHSPHRTFGWAAKTEGGFGSRSQSVAGPDRTTILASGVGPIRRGLPLVQCFRPGGLKPAAG